MNVLIIKIFAIIFFVANILMAQGDKEERFVFAEYCIHFDSEYRGHGEKGIWQLTRIEQFMPMPNIKIDLWCSKSYFNSTDVGNINGKIVMGSGYFKEIQSCAANYDCGFEINNEYKIGEDFETILTTVADSTQALSLINKIHSFKWSMNFKCSEKKLYDLSGIFDIKISGFCNKEQLKKIEEIKKNDK
jgi:uncharacterized protein YlzI (FlbEa/FlbD family)